jgi:hypothetical protein
MDTEMRAEGRLIFCMLHQGDLCFMLNQRAGIPVKLDNYEGIRLYWTPTDIHETRERLIQVGFVVSDLCERDYGHTEFFLTDDDGYSHCFGVAANQHLDAGQVALLVGDESASQFSCQYRRVFGTPQ